MPIVKRSVEPYYASRATVPTNVDNTLQCIVVSTLSNVLRQLGSLAKHAEDLFGEVFAEACSFIDRTKRLRERVGALGARAKALDAAKDKVSFEDMAMYKHFQSTHSTDQKLLSRTSLPAALADQYQRCSPPPKLDKFDPYREDERYSLAFYTDPDYFFDLWKISMEQRPKKRQKNKDRKPKQQGSTAGKAVKVNPVNKRQQRAGVSAELDDDIPVSKTPKGSARSKDKPPARSSARDPTSSPKPPRSHSTAVTDSVREKAPPLPAKPPGYSAQAEIVYEDPTAGQAYHAPPSPPPPIAEYEHPYPDDEVGYETPEVDSGYMQPDNLSPPPPPPPPAPEPSIQPPPENIPAPPRPPHLSSAAMSPLKGSFAPPANTPPALANKVPPPAIIPPPPADFPPSPANFPPPSRSISSTPANIPPPPGNVPPPPAPPPPSSSPNMPRAGPPKPTRQGGGGLASGLQGVALKKPSAAPAPKPAAAPAPRDNLMEAIRLGKRLRNVQVQKQESSTREYTDSGVAGILARRIAIEQSDSENDGDEGSDWDDEDWT